MTREEAITKVRNVDQKIGINDAALVVDSLEALGLIKFKELVKDIPSMIIKNHLARWVDQPMLKADEIVNGLYLAGYMIIKKGEN